MKRINKIMVAVDFSDYSLAAAIYAADLAKDMTASVLLTNIYNQRDIDMMNKVALQVPEFSVKQYLDERVKDRSGRLEEIAKRFDNRDLDVETNVRIGVPYEGLLQEIEGKKPDLLVMGSKGRSNIVDTIIGSCAQKMFRRCPIPLLLLRENQPDA